MTLWRDRLRGRLNAMFHRQVRVVLPPENCTNSPSKWFHLRSKEKKGEQRADKETRDSKDSSGGSYSHGEWLTFTTDHVLPMHVYEPLLEAIQDAVVDRTPFRVSLVALLEQIQQADLSLVARPLVNIFAFSQSIRPLMCKLFEYEIAKCQDMHTLFRSQSLAIMVMNELMREYGYFYLIQTIKPVMDTIYNDHLCCEVDPSKLQAGDENLEENQSNLVAYFTACFERVVSSADKCPFPLREIFSDLRNVVRRTTGKHEVEMLALSSFLVMRFFALAILNPQSFGVKRDQPGQDSRIGRTLALLSKMLQRLANCIVSTQPLISKESWLVPVMTRVTSEENKRAMCAYLETISTVDSEKEAEKERTDDETVIMESAAVVKEGTLVHHTVMSGKGMLRRIIGGSGKKKRHVLLTETEVGWQKTRGAPSLRERISLAELTTIDRTTVSVFRIRSDHAEMIFEAATPDESTEWINSIKRTRLRALVRARPHDTALHAREVDIARELEAVHTVLVDKANTLAVWKSCCELGTTTVPAGTQSLPNEMQQDPVTRAAFVATLNRVLEVTYIIEKAHQTAVMQYQKETSAVRGNRENLIRDDEQNLIVSKL